MNMQEKNISENNFEQCIKCTVCTVYCPVVPVNPLYPGPKQAGPDGERLRLKKGLFFDDTLKYCLNCKRCEVACPSGVRIGDIIQAARIRFNESNPKLRDMILANTDFMGTVATIAAPVVNATISGNRVLEGIDVSTLLQLETLDVQKFKLQSLDVTKNVAKNIRRCYSGGITIFCC